MRLDSAVYDRLKHSAVLANRSITAQAEMLLTQHTTNLGRMLSVIAVMVGALEEQHGVKWEDDPSVRAECIVAAKMLIDLTFKNEKGAADKPLNEVTRNGTSEQFTRRLDTITSAVAAFDQENSETVP